ncbi:MAG: hypothetical protein PHT07_14845 [Paludibacter sp.]|nr:hypothetical protein [Paludibacter sp.]
MKATNLSNRGSSRAPDEWKEIPEIKAAKPVTINREISLQKLDGFNICVWMTGWGGSWVPNSDLFHVRK